MPITKTIEETVRRTVTLMTLQEYADASLPENMRQPLKILHEALEVHGWDKNPLPDDYRPICCDKEVNCESFFLSGTYLAYCETCGNFIFDVTGPTWGNSYVGYVDSEKVDLETDIERRWIAARKEAHAD